MIEGYGFLDDGLGAGFEEAPVRQYLYQHKNRVNEKIGNTEHFYQRLQEYSVIT